MEILKLRTMVDGADELRSEFAALNETDGLFKIAADPRVTRIGASCTRPLSTRRLSC